MPRCKERTAYRGLLLSRYERAYYNEWKILRSASSKIFRSGNINFTGALQSVESNYFYGWCRDKFAELDKQQRWDYSKRDIISLRDEFRKDRGLT